MMEGEQMSSGRGGEWQKEVASVPYWFFFSKKKRKEKSIRRAHFIPVHLSMFCHSSAHLKRCQLANWEVGRLTGKFVLPFRERGREKEKGEEKEKKEKEKGEEVRRGRRRREERKGREGGGE